MKWIMDLVKRYKRQLTFCIVGGINTGVDVAVFTVLYMFTALRPGIAQAFAYTAGITTAFVLNRGITFRDGENTRIWSQLVRFLLVNLVSMAVRMVGIELLLAAGMATWLATGMLIVTTMVINYVGYKFFVFKVNENKDESE